MASNITIKKANDSTDIVWTAKQGAGAGGKAVYVSATVGTSLSTRPTFEVSSSESKNGYRHVNGVVKYPTPATDVNGSPTPGPISYFDFHAAIHPNSTDTDVSEMIYQAANLIDHADIKTALVTGFAPA